MNEFLYRPLEYAGAERPVKMIFFSSAFRAHVFCQILLIKMPAATDTEGRCIFFDICPAIETDQVINCVMRYFVLAGYTFLWVYDVGQPAEETANRCLSRRRISSDTETG